MISLLSCDNDFITLILDLVPHNSKNNSIISYQLKLHKVTINKTKFELAQYSHACAFSPCLRTFTTDTRIGNFISWPGIDDINFYKCLGNTPATALGHLDQEKKDSNRQKKKQKFFFTTGFQENLVRCN